MTAVFAIAPITPAEIQERLYEAVRTLDQVPDPQKVMGYVCSMPAPVPSKQDHWAEAVQVIRRGDERELFANSTIRTIPAPDAIDRMLPTLKWLTWVDEKARPIIHSRAYGLQWWRIAKKTRTSERTCRRRHSEAIDIIFERVNTA